MDCIDKTAAGPQPDTAEIYTANSDHKQKSIITSLNYLGVFIKSIDRVDMTPEVIARLKTISANISDITTNTDSPSKSLCNMVHESYN